MNSLLGIIGKQGTTVTQAPENVQIVNAEQL